MDTKYIPLWIAGIIAMILVLAGVVSCEAYARNLDARCRAQGYYMGAEWQVGKSQVYCMQMKYSDLEVLEK